VVLPCDVVLPGEMTLARMLDKHRATPDAVLTSVFYEPVEAVKDGEWRQMEDSADVRRGEAAGWIGQRDGRGTAHSAPGRIGGRLGSQNVVDHIVSLAVVTYS
jgi:hypothetical protein